MDNNFHIRQTGLIDPAKLTMPIAIIGGGSIGGWTALALLKLGCSDVTVYDFDIVEEHNVGSQIYTSADIGTEKVEALKERLGLLTDTELKIVNERYTSETDLSGYSIIISAVDNMASRKEIFDNLNAGVLLIDGRMGGNAIEIYKVNTSNEEDNKIYENTLFSDSEAAQVDCSFRSVVYNVFVMAGFITDIVAKFANEKDLPRALEVDLENLAVYK